MFGLANLVSPLSTDEFISHYFGREACLIPSAKPELAKLLNWEDINHLVSYTPKVARSAAIIADTKAQPESELFNLGKHISEGATYIINHVQHKDAVMDRFARNLSRDLNTRVNINVYVSAESKQGFKNHFDRHDVFIVQNLGQKDWKVFRPTFEHPLEYTDTKDLEPPDTDPYLECTLSPGEVLYIPRGHWHYALAKESTVHMTVGSNARSGMDFLRWFSNKELWESAFMRQSFPLPDSGVFGGSRSAEELEEHFDLFRKYLTEKMNAPEFFEMFQEYIMTENLFGNQPSVQLPGHLDIKASINENTVFELPEGQKLLFQERSGSKSATLLSRGLIVDAEGIGIDVLETLFARPNNINAASIQTRFPEIDPKDIVRFLLNLLRLGVIRLNPGSDNPGGDLTS